MAKKITLESLAGMVQCGFDEITSIVATKEELRDGLGSLRVELHGARDYLAQAIRELEARFVNHSAEERDEIKQIKTWMCTVENRIESLEQKGKL